MVTALLRAIGMHILVMVTVERVAVPLRFTMILAPLLVVITVL